MTTVAPAGLLSLSFADLEEGIWGTAWCEAESFMALGTLEPGVAHVDGSVSLVGEGPDGQWTLSGQAIEVRVSPQGEAAALTGGDGFDQLCRVRGRMMLGGEVREFEVAGVRGSRSSAMVDELGSIRGLSACFGDGDGFALSSLRPPGATGHNRDVVTASLFEPGGVLGVAEARLSTTYTAEGVPLRTGLELWLEQDDSEEQYPRRAAGQALGPVAAATAGRHEFRARPFRWQSHGLEGGGVYLLAGGP